jgi:hypothetical protein
MFWFMRREFCTAEISAAEIWATKSERILHRQFYAQFIFIFITFF